MRLSFATGLFWISVACCAIAQLYILRSVGGGRHLAEPAAGVPRERRSLEVVWAVVPAIALAVLLFFTWRAVRAPRAEPLPSHSPREAAR
jgi:heme/copper-type cytochrome/quinol oxidase subunit 2